MVFCGRGVQVKEEKPLRSFHVSTPKASSLELTPHTPLTIRDRSLEEPYPVTLYLTGLSAHLARVLKC